MTYDKKWAYVFHTIQIKRSPRDRMRKYGPSFLIQIMAADVGCKFENETSRLQIMRQYKSVTGPQNGVTNVSHSVNTGVSAAHPRCKFLPDFAEKNEH